MAKHARDNRMVGDKRSALANSRPVAYSHSDQVGGTRRREADGRWVDRGDEPAPERPKPISQQSMGEVVANNMVYILAVVAVAVVVVLVILGVRMFAGLLTPIPSEEGYTSPYDWSKLDRTNGRYAYVVDGQVKSCLGIDVSEHDEDIDWQAVANDGIDFAIVRLGYRGSTEGILELDDYYEQNMAGAKAAGLDLGVYFFSQATTPDEAREEAAFVLANLKGASLVYPIAFDWERVSGLGETRTAGMTSEEITAVADAFCDAIEAAGYRTLVYGNGYDMRLVEEEATAGRHIWWAEYGVASPSHYLDISMWQYSSDGQVDGMHTGADMNLDLSGVFL